MKRLIIIVYRHAFPTHFLVLPSKLQGLSPSHASLPSLPSAALLARDFFSGARGYFFVRLAFFGVVFLQEEPQESRGRAAGGAQGWGKAAHHGRPLRTRGKATAGRGGGKPSSLLSLYGNATEESDFQKNIFIIDNAGDKSGGRRVRPLLPEESALRSARSAGMRGGHRGAAPTAIAPGSSPSRYCNSHDYYYSLFLPLQPQLASFNLARPQLHPLGHSPGWEKSFPRVGYSVPGSRLPSFPSPVSCRLPPLRARCCRRCFRGVGGTTSNPESPRSSASSNSCEPPLRIQRNIRRLGSDAIYCPVIKVLSVFLL